MTEEALKIEEISAQKKMKHIFRMAKVKASNKKDIVGNPCIEAKMVRWSAPLSIWLSQKPFSLKL